MNSANRTQKINRAILTIAIMAIVTTTLWVIYTKSNAKKEVRAEDTEANGPQKKINRFHPAQKLNTKRKRDFKTQQHTFNHRNQNVQKKQEYVKNALKQHTLKPDVLKDEKEILAQKNNTAVDKVAQYYVNLFTHGARNTHSAQQVKQRMFNLAVSSIVVLNENKDAPHLQPVLTMKQEIVKHCVMFNTLITFESKIHEQYGGKASIQQRQACMSEALNTFLSDTHALFVVDFAMLNLARAACVVHGNVEYDALDMEALNATSDYITSVIAQLAYIPYNSDIVHARSALQKSTALEKMTLNNYVMGLAIDATLHANYTLPQTPTFLRVCLGHTIMLNLLSGTNCMLHTCVVHAKHSAGRNAQTILADIMKTGGADIEADKIYDHFMHTIKALILSKQNFMQKRTILQKLQQDSIVKAMSLQKDDAYKNKVVMLLHNFMQLSPKEKGELELKLYSPRTKQTKQALQLLHYSWDLENSLYNMYVEHYKLQNLAQQCPLHTQICSAMSNKIDDVKLQELRKIVQAQRLDANESCDNFDTMFGALDLDNRAGDIYDTKEESRYNMAMNVSNNILYLVMQNIQGIEQAT